MRSAFLILSSSEANLLEHSLTAALADGFDDGLVVDNASSDGTPEYLRDVAARPGPARVEIIRNDTNVGFPAGCNQALARVRGE